MKPLYFGNVQKQLYGVYHAPNTESNVGIVLCPPIGEEYTRAHRAFTLIANKLADSGFHVLRFDYFATGDSAGDSGEGDVKQWTNDIHDAIDKLSEISHTKHISLLGLRFGATLAAYASQTKSVDKLVLVEPIKNGNDCINSLTYLNSLLIKQHKEKTKHINIPLDFCEGELLGFVFPENLQNSISQTNLENCALSANYAHVISTDKKEDFLEVSTQFNKLPTEVKYSFFEIEDSWSSLESLKQAHIPSAIVQCIINSFTAK